MDISLRVVHTVGWNRYLMAGGARLGLLALTVAAIAAVARLRVLRHQQLAISPYVVEEVVVEDGDATTLNLRADGHDGQPFGPGQFAWIKLADAPLGVDEHPFSYSSSAARPDRPGFTIRPYAGFSARVAALPVGTRILVDGPHGAFRSSRRSRGLALVANGIGITPMMSILRTAADRGDKRHFVLVYGTPGLDTAPFRAELATLDARLHLDVVHVLSRAGADWRGPRGRITAATLAAALPPRLRGWEFFLCGASPAVDASLTALTQLGVPPERVHAERFVEV